MVGPFMLLDQFGPADSDAAASFEPLQSVECGLAVLTYLFDGEIVRTDNLGRERTIRAGEVCQITTTSGSIRSRSAHTQQRRGANDLFGMEAWIARDAINEDDEATILHFGTSEIPRLCESGVEFTLIAGTSDGMISPVTMATDLVYAAIVLTSGATYRIKPEHRERAIYVVGGDVELVGSAGLLGEAELIILDPGRDYVVTAPAFHSARLVLLGGARTLL
jgi:redox-sensitive bicupin YhaK (pirin superfamily)